MGSAAVILVAAAVVFVLFPRFRERRRMECLNNLRQIHSAVINLAYERGYFRGDVVPEKQIAEVTGPDGKHIAVCPSGGHYVIPPVGGHPVCSFHGDPFAPGGELSAPPSPLELGLHERPSK
jgi:hypothetical protein